ARCDQLPQLRQVILQRLRLSLGHGIRAGFGGLFQSSRKLPGAARHRANTLADVPVGAADRRPVAHLHLEFAERPPIRHPRPPKIIRRLEKARGQQRLDLSRVNRAQFYSFPSDAYRFAHAFWPGFMKRSTPSSSFSSPNVIARDARSSTRPLACQAAHRSRKARAQTRSDSMGATASL